MRLVKDACPILRARRYIKAGRIWRALRPLLGNGLILAEGEDHIRQRQQIGAALRAERFAGLWGHYPASEGQLAALRAVLCAPAGYEPPAGSTGRIVRIWHGLRQWEIRGIVRRIKRPAADDGTKRAAVLFAARDACPDCLGRDGQHGDGCGLTFGDVFAERIEKSTG